MVKNTQGGNKSKGFARKNLSKKDTALRISQDENEIYAPFHYVPLHSSPAGKKFCKTSSKMSKLFFLQTSINFILALA